MITHDRRSAWNALNPYMALERQVRVDGVNLGEWLDEELYRELTSGDALEARLVCVLQQLRDTLLCRRNVEQ